MLKEINISSRESLDAFPFAEWKECRHKPYDVTVQKVEPNFIVANKFEQPAAYKYIQEKFRVDGMIRLSRLKPYDAQFLRSCPLTDRMNCIVVTGVLGEKWVLDLREVRHKYSLMNWQYLDESLMDRPIVVHRIIKDEPVLACRIPIEYRATLQLRDGQDVVYQLNHPLVKNHGAGDYVVSETGSSKLTPVNAEVFEKTFALV